MTFELRSSTQKIKDLLYASYRRNPKMALLTVKTGGGKTYGAIHTFGSMMPNCTLMVFTTSKVVQSKQWEKSVKDYNQVMSTHLKIICTNYEKLLSQKYINHIFELFNKLNFNQIVLILDEVHRIKMASSGKLSKRAQIILKLAKEPFIVTTLGLSATAFSNSYLDVAPYLIIAGYYRNKTQFLREHVKREDEYHQPIVTDDTGKISRNAFINPDQIDMQIKSITSYVDTSVYKPKVKALHLRFKLDRDERRVYNDIEYRYKNKEYDYPIQARMDQERVLATKTASSKDAYLLSLIEMQKTGKLGINLAPILIFHEYTSVGIHLLGLLKRAYPNRPIIQINGRVKKNKTFLTKPPSKDAIYLVQYEAGGEGLDWQWSNMSVFYEAPVRYEKFEQAKGRNVRDKTKMPLVCQFGLEYINTLDSERWLANQNKQDFTKDVSVRTFLKGLKKHK